MPSTVVHIAFGLLVATAVLGPYFDRRALLVVAGAVAFVDLDTLTSLLLESTHRALLHTLLLPLFAATYLYAETHLSERSVTRERYGERGVRVAWAAIAAVVIAAIGLDLFTAAGVNILYPVHDQFYSFTGNVNYSAQSGVQQSFVEFQTATSEPNVSADAKPSMSIDPGSKGSTREYHVGSGLNPDKGREAKDVKRIFPIVQRGWQLWLVIASVVGVTMRARLRPDPPATDNDATGDPAPTDNEPRAAVRRMSSDADTDESDAEPELDADSDVPREGSG